MMLRKKFGALFTGLLCALACGTPAFADDTEIFVDGTRAEGVRPNVLFIIDTSGSMNGLVDGAKSPYDPARDYDGDCRDDRLYWSRSSSPVPSCSTTREIDRDALKCRAALTAINGSAGLWSGQAAQFDDHDEQWAALTAGEHNWPVECAADAGLHGEADGSNAVYARNGDKDNPWTADSSRQIGWSGADVYTIYSGNWLNWYRSPPDGAAISRLDTVKAVAASLAGSLTGVNLGLMRFSDNGGSGDARAEGGMITHEIANVDDSRTSLIDRVMSYSASGFTPLSETLYEAGQYFAGRGVDYGVDSRIDDGATSAPSVAESRDSADPASYRSPIEYQCQKNYVVLLTDGEPTADNSADDKITSLPGYGSAVGEACTADGPGRCLTNMAKYLREADVSPVAGEQNVTTYTVGFGPEVAGSTLLAATAAAGGGESFSASNVDDLTDALRRIFSSILQTNSTFTTPSVSINAFNRAETLNDLYISVFEPADTVRWNGNLKKYGLQGGKIVDAAGRDAVDPETGFFRSGSRSFWSGTPDDDRVDLGGAVGRLPAPALRKLYTWLPSAGSPSLDAAGNAFSVDNAALTDALLGLGDPGLPTREQLISWARGVDVLDKDGDGDFAEQRRTMGDPLHARPAVVPYGGTTDSPDAEDVVVFVPTNDGFLHAVDATTGNELWAFVPPELLNELPEKYINRSSTTRSYGLDGDVRVLRFDANGDGVVNAAGGDRVFIYFGMRRGGKHYYALDVTDRAAPQLLWNIGPADLPGIGETWSPPTVARVDVSGAAQNGEKLVLIFGGGYDGAQENYAYTADSTGHRLYMVDAASGELLWYAGGPDGPGSPDLALDDMNNSFPSRIVVIDTNGDKFADRMYAADMGGRVWRFDITNGQSRGTLVAGGVFARLGAGDVTPTDANRRRFYYAPDVALISRRGADPYYNLAIGSGYRGHPLETATEDRFYSLRDKNPFGRMSAGAYAAFAPIVEGDLVDISGDIAATPVPTTARGWKLELRLNGGWVGEKVLAEAITVNGTILFPTYQPVARAEGNPCVPANGINRVYALGVDSGKPVVDFNDDGAVNADDASTQLAQSGIAGEVGFALETTVDALDGGDDGDDNGDGEGNGLDALGRRGVCLVGVEVLKKCVMPGGVVRTFWQRVASGSD